MKKKLLCMMLSAAMVFNAGNFSALTLVYAKEAETSVTENSASSESTAVQTEEIIEDAISQESEKISATDSNEIDTNADSSTKDETQTEDSEIENDTVETEKASTEENSNHETLTGESSIIETSTDEPSSKEEITTEESAIQDTTITETEEITETETEDVMSSEDKNIENAADAERTTKLEAAYHSADEIKAFLEQQKAEKEDKVTFAQAPSVTVPYKAGALSDATLESAVAMINQIRFIAGLPYEVTSDKEYSQYSQAAALVNYINGELSYEPSKPEEISEDLYKKGQEGALNSNIAYNESDVKPLNETIVDAWMAGDDNSNRFSLEYRRWILNPSMGKVGFGAVKGSKGTYSAMYATDCSGNNETIFGVAWPAQNTPIEYFDAAYPWSVSTGERLEAKDIEVTLTRKSDGKEWTFANESADGVFYVDNDSYGQKGCIIFQPNMQDITELVDGDAFQVEITNNKETYLSYNVTFFSLTEEEEKLTTPKASITSGEVVAKESKLVLTSEEDAAVYYTVDGSEPTLDSTLYTEPIFIEADITVKAIAVKEGYESSEIVTFTYTVEEDVPLRYTITFDSNGGTIVPAQSIQENEKAELPENPTKEGYLLEGWYKEAECENKWDFAKESVTMDITLYAKWEENAAEAYTVNFDLQGQGTPIASVTANSKEHITAPDAPIAEGYLFEGWYKETECINAWNFETDIIEADVILYAKWTEIEEETTETDVTYIVTYDMQGLGEPIAPESVSNGELLAKPDAPLAEGYSFAEWYKEAECVNAWDFEEDVVSEDIVLYAKWVQDDEVVMSTGNLREAENEPIDLSAEVTDTKINDIKSKVYTGKPYEPNVTVKIFNGKKRVTLKKGRDYTVKYQNNINAGENTGIVTVTGMGKYKGSVQKNFTITRKNVKKLKIITESKCITDKSAKVVIYDGTILLNNNLFTFTFTDPEDPKKAKVKITAKENTNYTGEVTAKITVYDSTKVQLIHSDKFTMSGDTVYTGKAITREIKGKIGETDLIKNKDYKVQYQNNINVGTALVIITGKGKYKGKVVLAFNISKAPINNEDYVSIAQIPPKIYNGKEQKPAVTVRTSRKKLALNKDYTVSYLNNIHSGTATIQVKAIGNNCSGSKNITFKIEPQEIKKVSVKVKKTEDNQKKIVLTYNKKTLQEYADYMITNYEEVNNKVKVTIKGIADFKNDVTKTLKIDMPEESDGTSPAKSKNINGHNYSDFEGSDIRSYMYQNDDGNFIRVEYIGSMDVCIESYTPEYKFVSQKIIKLELPKFGGFYSGKDYNFLAFGQRNPESDNSKEVLRIVKYDKSWNRLDDVRLFGANTLDPFKNGSLRMVECDDMLYVRTCHQMYNTHQANISLTVQISDMEVKQQLTGVYNLSWNGYVSHSYNQYVLVDDDMNLLTVDHGDAFPRSVVMVKYNNKAGNENAFGGCQVVHALPIKGSGAHTGVSVGGFEASDTAYLTAGNSVEQNTETYSAGGIRNIFVTSTRKDNFSASGNVIRWITNYKYIEYTDVKGNPQKTPEAVVTTPHLVKINGNEMMLLWTETVTVIEDNKPVKSISHKSLLLNGLGEPISGIYTFDNELSDCKPIVLDGKLIWYFTNGTEPVFCSLNIEDVRKQPK